MRIQANLERSMSIANAVWSLSKLRFYSQPLVDAVCKVGRRVLRLHMP